MNSKRFSMWAMIVTAVAGGALLCGCGTDARTAELSGAVAETNKPAADPLAGIFGPAPQKTGVQLWSENCTRCHNSRPPTAFSGAQWTLIAAHMRSRANLTGDEERKILTLLQAGAGTE